MNEPNQQPTTDEGPTDLGSAGTVEYRRANKRAIRQERLRARHERRRAEIDPEVVAIYEPHVRYVPPLMPYLRSLWERRAFMLALAQSKVRSNRANTALGPLWALLDPMFQIAIYYFLFSVIRGGDRPPTFLPMLIFGILHFQISAAALSEGGQSVTGGKNLMLNSTFPRALLPLAAILTGGIKFIPAIPVIIGALVLLSAPFTVQLLWWPVLFALQLLIGLGLALTVSTLVVFFRDVKNVLSYVSRVMFFTSPVMYPSEVIPEGIRDYIIWAPLHGVFANYQGIITGVGVDMQLLAISIAWGVGGTVFGGWVFLRHEREFGRMI